MAQHKRHQAKQPQRTNRLAVKSHELLDKTFEVSVLLKGADGLLELLGGLLLLFIRPQTIDKLIVLLTQHELSRDPNDWFANHILRSAAHLHSTQLFGAIYLLLHGIIKIGLVWALLKKQLWAYPATVIIFAGFIVYQLYRITITHSIALVLLTIFDAFVIWLVWREYQVVRLSTTQTTS